MFRRGTAEKEEGSAWHGPPVLTVLLGSLVLALVVSTVFYQITARASGAGSGRTKEPSRDLIVAARPLSIGIPVTALDVRVQAAPASTFPKGGFGKAEDVIGRPVSATFLRVSRSWRAD